MTECEECNEIEEEVVSVCIVNWYKLKARQQCCNRHLSEGELLGSTKADCSNLNYLGLTQHRSDTS